MSRVINVSAGCTDPGETDADKWAALNRQCGGSDVPIRAALGYLSLWNWSSFPHVDIVLMGRGGCMELCAYYRTEAGGKAGYVIGAVWHENAAEEHGGHFGFHS